MLSLSKGQPDCEWQPSEPLLQGTPALSRGKEVQAPGHNHSCAPSGPPTSPKVTSRELFQLVRPFLTTQSLAPLPQPVQLLLPSPSVRLEQEYLYLEEAGFTVNPHGLNKEQNIPNQLALFYFYFFFKLNLRSLSLTSQDCCSGSSQPARHPADSALAGVHASRSSSRTGAERTKHPAQQAWLPAPALNSCAIFLETNSTWPRAEHLRMA